MEGTMATDLQNFMRKAFASCATPANPAPEPVAIKTPQHFIMRRRRVLEMLDIGARTFQRLLAKGKFPPADLKPTRRLHYWKWTTVEAWIETEKWRAIELAKMGADSPQESRRGRRKPNETSLTTKNPKRSKRTASSRKRRAKS